MCVSSYRPERFDEFSVVDAAAVISVEYVEDSVQFSSVSRELGFEHSGDKLVAIYCAVL